MAKEIVSTAISNWDSSNPIQASVVEYVSDPTKKWLVICNPDWSSIWPFLKLDQSTPQTIINWAPTFSNWITIWTSYTPTWNEPTGTIYWSDEDEMFVWVGNNGFKYNFWSELTTLCQNDTWDTIPDWTPVMYAGSVWNSWNIRMIPAIADWAIPASYMLWLATQETIDWDRWKVTWFGKVRAISQDLIETGQTWSVWDLIYVSENEAGKLTNVQPQAPNCTIFVWALVALWDSKMTIDVGVNVLPRLTDLCDVNWTPLTETWQIMVWDNDRKVFDFNFNILKLFEEANNYYYFQVDEADATYYYFGYLQENTTSWRIRRVNKSDYSVWWATWTSDYSTNWTNRTTLTYNPTL